MNTAEENPVTNPADEAGADAEAERLFAEAAEAIEGKPADKAGAADDQSAVTTQNDDEGEAQPGEGDEGGDADDDQPGQDGAASDTPPASGSGEFDWSKADPAAKAAFEAAQQQFEHKLKSANGRVSVLDRKLQELRKGGTGGEQEQPRKPLKELLESDQLKEIGKEYPDFQAVLNTLGEIANRVDGVEAEVGNVRHQAVAVATSAEETKLNQAVPNWLDLARDERFLGWVDDQPKRVRDAVAANWDGITNAAEVAEVFKSFEEFANPAAPAKDETTNSGGKSGKRERQQAGARAATVTAPAAAGGDSDDPAVLFAQAAAKVDRERGLRT